MQSFKTVRYIKTFWVIASHLELSHHNENVDGQTNRQTDETKNLYISTSYCRVELCKVSKLYDKNVLSFHIASWVITSQRKCWRTDERTGGQNPEFIHFCLLWYSTIVQSFKTTIKTFWVIASHLELYHYNENLDGQTNGRADGTQNL